MARKRCKHGRRADGRCRRKPANGRGLGGSTSTHLAQVMRQSHNAISAAKGAARQTRCSTAIHFLLDAAEAAGSTQAHLFAVTNSDDRKGLKAKHFGAMDRANAAVSAARQKVFSTCGAEDF